MVSIATIRQFLLVSLVLMAGAVTVDAQPAALDRGLDEIARVNGVIITRRDFQVAYRAAVDRHAREGRPINEAHIAPVRQAVIERLIDDELLYQESLRLGINIAEAEIDALVAAARARSKDPAAFEQELAQQYLDMPAYRRQLRRQQAIKQVIARQVMPSVAVSEEDLRDFYQTNRQRYQIPEKVRLSHILIRTSPGDGPDQSPTARRTIERIRAQLLEGEDFATLARQYSEEPRREAGGDLGYVQRGQIRPQLEDAVFNLAVGETSPILTTTYGFHLFRVTDRTPKRDVSFAEARAQIQKTLVQRRRDQAVALYIDSLRKKADIHATR
ncbi:MAG: peptidylprolyl isomerase [Desulfobacterales bacterium]|jgi:parvulin-like peptidyl-prolyl isomerase